MPLSITEQLMYSTLRIECDYKDGQQGTGTGFIYRMKYNPEIQTHILTIITNKHVLEGAEKVRFSLSKDADGVPKDSEHWLVEYTDFEVGVRNHPDPEVDLCALPIEPILEGARERGFPPFFTFLDEQKIPTEQQINDLSALEEVLMVGYPNGIWDRVNNKPIFRKGITATHPAINYNGKKEFMIDAACYPGSSGSPVFIVNEGGYTDKRGNTYMGTSRVLLLGILYAGPQYSAEGEIKIIDVPTQNRRIAISEIPMNLGVIIKSERILELRDLFED